MARPYIPKDLRQLVLDRSKGNCEYCRILARVATESMEVDHVLPISQGGLTVAENLASACHGCNQRKRDRLEGFDLVSGKTVPIYNPRTMKWKRHFAWSEDSTLIIGRTATGRVTVELMGLNRSGLVNLRALLIMVGEHPPK
jgi:hypothetical protein